MWTSVNRWLTWLHRWVGVTLCLLFCMWFATGAVLHFVGFPELTAQQRHALSEPIDLATLKYGPTVVQPYLRGPAADVSLISVAGKPVYIVSDTGLPPVAVDAASGQRLADFSARTAQTVAERFARARAMGVVGPFLYDQWIVHQRFDPFRPFYRVRLSDAARTDIYVSARTGEALQRTTRQERVLNWVGAVLHWIYFTPLRQRWWAWNELVWWLSAVALLTSAVGTWLGFVRLIAGRAAGRSGLSPFRGWMKWHHVIGLFAGIVVLVWIFSGWLSMDHGRLFSTGAIDPAESERMYGMAQSDVISAASLTDVRSMTRATEIEFRAIDGRPFLVAWRSNGGTRIQWLDGLHSNAVSAPLAEAQLLHALCRAWPNSIVRPSAADGTDELYRRAESIGADALGVDVLSAHTLRVYVDRQDGRLLVVMDPSRRAYAWVYYALHTLKFPALLNLPAVRTVLVVILMVFGLAFSTTGVVLAFNRLKRQLSA